MRAATQQRTRIDRLHEADWLYRLLADMHEEVASHPGPQAIARIRARLLAQIKAPARAAA